MPAEAMIITGERTAFESRSSRSGNLPPRPARDLRDGADPNHYGAASPVAKRVSARRGNHAQVNRSAAGRCRRRSRHGNFPLYRYDLVAGRAPPRRGCCLAWLNDFGCSQRSGLGGRSAPRPTRRATVRLDWIPISISAVTAAMTRHVQVRGSAGGSAPWRRTPIARAPPILPSACRNPSAARQAPRPARKMPPEPRDQRNPTQVAPAVSRPATPRDRRRSTSTNL